MNLDIALNQKQVKVSPKAIAVKVNYWWLILISMALRVLPYTFGEASLLVELKRACLVLSYAVLLFVLVRNLRIKGIWIIGIGTVLNFIAILANGFLMPVSPEARFLAGKTPFIIPVDGITLTGSGGIVLPAGETRLRFLTDIFPVSTIHTVFSIGDIIIGVGIMFVCIYLVVQTLKQYRLNLETIKN